MKLSDDQIRILIDKFVSSEEAKIWIDKRRNDNKRWKEWINPEMINNLPDAELKNRYLEYFNKGAGRHPFNAIYRDRVVGNIKKFRETMRYLLDESIPVEDRLKNILSYDGKYRIEGIGKGLATSLLTDLNPDKYSTWNNKTNMGLDALGLTPDFSRGDDWGSKYCKVMSSIRHIRSLKSDWDFLVVDHFLHIVSAEKEGQEALEALIEGRGVSVDVSETIDRIAKEQESMEFVLEKYLEEFIEANFERINFGSKLELFEDEESKGRQYRTQFGAIDLLTIDREKNEFVVIELKKGRSSDVVVGQILRYMGWIKENIADDAEVRGIIIAKERDDKLEYALKFTPMISLFLYNVSFHLKKII